MSDLEAARWKALSEAWDTENNALRSALSAERTTRLEAESTAESAAAALRAEPEKTLAREAEGVALFDKLLADANTSGRVVREEADYFKAAYARKLDDEKRALEAAHAAIELNTSLTVKLAKLELEHSALANALLLCVKWMPLADVRSWPPGFRLRKEALHAADTALRLAGRLP